MNAIVIQQSQEALKEAVHLHRNASMEKIRLSKASFASASASENPNQAVSLVFRFGSKAKPPQSGLLRLTVDFGIEGRPNDEKQTGATGQRPVFSLNCTYELDYRLRAGFTPTKRQVKAFREGNAVFNIWPYFREYLQDTLARMGWPPLTAPFLRIEAEQMSEEKRQRLCMLLKALKMTLQDPDDSLRVNRLIELVEGTLSGARLEPEGPIAPQDLIRLENLIASFRARIGRSSLEDARNHKTATEVLDLVSRLRG